jgi:hypothetical protein
MKKIKRMAEATDEELKEYFETLVEPLVKYIRRHWCWKGLKPKRFKKIIERMDNGEDEELTSEDQKIMDTFKGLSDSQGAHCAFHIRTAPYMTAFDKVDQGRDPLTVLIQSAVSWGAHLATEQEKRKLFEEENHLRETRKKLLKINSDMVNHHLSVALLIMEDSNISPENLAKIRQAFETLKDTASEIHKMS